MRETLAGVVADVADVSEQQVVVSGAAVGEGAVVAGNTLLAGVVAGVGDAPDVAVRLTVVVASAADIEIVAVVVAVVAVAVIAVIEASGVGSTIATGTNTGVWERSSMNSDSQSSSCH